MAKKVYSETIDNIDIDTTLTGIDPVIHPEAYGIENYRYVSIHSYKSNAIFKFFIKDTPQVL